VKIWVNGHEWAKQQARKIRLGFTEMSNGFAACDDPALRQRICDSLQSGTIEVFFQRWLHRLSLPLGPADQDAGWWWELSMAQVEVSSTIVFTQPRHARGFFDALVTRQPEPRPPRHHGNHLQPADPNRPAARHPGRVQDQGDHRGTEVIVNAFYKHSRIRQYLKEGRAPRVETVINDAYDVGCQRRLHNLSELQARARAINARLLDTNVPARPGSLRIQSSGG
jgi:hypothetical protein